MASLSGLDIVLVYGPPWDEPTRVSKHHLARHWARRNRVIYLESPLHPLNLARRPGQAFRNLRRCIQPPAEVELNLWVKRWFNPVPYHSATPLTNGRSANWLGQRYLRLNLVRLLRRLGSAVPLYVAGLPHALDLLDGMPRRALVYHCADEYASVSGFPTSLPQLEHAFARAADLVITTSQGLYERRRAWNANTHVIANGVELEHFGRALLPETVVPPELEPIPAPRVGFVGALAEWVDLDLVAYLAAERPSWSFVLIGPQGVDVAGLARLPNVHLLGPRPYPSVPAYLKGFDVAIVPFRLNELTRKANPIKVYEYLAAGLPVVSTDLPELRQLAPSVELAASSAQFLAGCERALVIRGGSQLHARLELARRHGWEARFQEVERLIERAMSSER